MTAARPLPAGETPVATRTAVTSKIARLRRRLRRIRPGSKRERKLQEAAIETAESLLRLDADAGRAVMHAREVAELELWLEQVERDYGTSKRVVKILRDMVAAARDAWLPPEAIRIPPPRVAPESPPAALLQEAAPARALETGASASLAGIRIDIYASPENAMTAERLVAILAGSGARVRSEPFTPARRDPLAGRNQCVAVGAVGERALRELLALTRTVVALERQPPPMTARMRRPRAVIRLYGDGTGAASAGEAQRAPGRPVPAPRKAREARPPVPPDRFRFASGFLAFALTVTIAGAAWLLLGPAAETPPASESVGPSGANPVVEPSPEPVEEPPSERGRVVTSAVYLHFDPDPRSSVTGAALEQGRPVCILGEDTSGRWLRVSATRSDGDVSTGWVWARDVEPEALQPPRAERPVATREVKIRSSPVGVAPVIGRAPRSALRELGNRSGGWMQVVVPGHFHPQTGTLRGWVRERDAAPGT